MRLSVRGVASLSLFLLSIDVFAASFSLSDNVDREVISEAVPTAFEVAPFIESDFEPRWEGTAPAGVKLSMVPGSLTWVRVSRYLVLPRARIRVAAPGVQALQIRTAGVNQSLKSEGGDFPVSLFSGEHEMVLIRDGKQSSHRFSVPFSAERGAASGRLASRIFVDISCSPYRVSVPSEKLASDQWAYVGCRMIRSQSHGSPVPQLELHIAWSGVRGNPAISGVTQILPSQRQALVMTALLSAENPRILFEDPQGSSFELAASLPARLNLGFLGAGIGPYTYSLHVPGQESVNETAPILTLYGSYGVAEGARLVFFDAFPIHQRSFNDFGFYYHNESVRALDERVSINILLGFHLISFASPLGIQHRLGAPQGLELIYRDALGKRNNVSLGGFFYPPIAGKTYYNAWFRLGNQRVFAEINYLSWTELSGYSGQASSRSFGVSVGAPLWFL